MYDVNIEVRADILGNVVGRLKLRGIDAIDTKQAKRLAEEQAHKDHCHSYGIPVHFIATKAVFQYK
ncbi:hypothetical protein QB910_000142 [Dabrowskivirus KKP3916]|uniref:Uncharacterized protein n=1 Tax=Alicyclobacillus phage KKP_3916 TaxID=3040651 RepID=A0AAT9V7U1_9CAUD|nr:hypothetical protein QB910_000142 [Alicyclobacillus phage KKP 3916]